ncbi:MAG: phosphoribosylanthranilate isomerase [Deltaproteobacteria bacterium]|nr:phosphoribosylanthranilate isomerase [Deltaproteobacteria bacterium]
MSRPRIKICCISSEQEVAIAVAGGADLLGFVAPPLGGLGVIPVERIAELISLVPPGCVAVLLTGLTGFEDIANQVRLARPDGVQLVRSTTPETRRALREAFPGLRLLQVVHVHGEDAIDDALAAQEHSHGLVLDSAVLGGPTEQLGATGTTHDWSISARVVAAVDVPVYLAGGLSAANAAQARRVVGSFGLDLCSSVRTQGRLDQDKVSAFVAAAQSAP